MYEMFGKRLLDIIISIMVLPFVIVMSLPICLLIYLEDKGPVFYNAERLGKNGKVFKMYKFRSMKVNAKDIRNDDGSTFNEVNDPRLTKVGSFIRKTSLDEIPQVINVLKGDMSVIGPRPDLPEHINMYIDDDEKKLEVLPGITGYSQAYFRNSISWKLRISNDIYYIENMSFIFDIKIILVTIRSIIFQKNVFISKTTTGRNQ